MKIALVGNPNCGKTSLFNALTGLRQKVGNFPGVTVDRKTGVFNLDREHPVHLIDLPGTYSLYPRSEDEEVATRILIDKDHKDHPDLCIVVTDVTNIRRGLLLCSQVIDTGLPVILALNMADLIDKEGLKIDIKALEKSLGIPVLLISALKNEGLTQLKSLILSHNKHSSGPFFSVPVGMDNELSQAGKYIHSDNRYISWQYLVAPGQFSWISPNGVPEPKALADAEQLLSNELAVRYDRINDILEDAQLSRDKSKSSLTEKLDKILIHPVLGYTIFVLILFLVFQSIFAWATYPMELIDTGFTAVGELIRSILPAGFAADLLIDGIWAGLGGIVVFIPQIAFLFFFISVLEDSGYMSRVVFLMDRIMRPFGFSGRSVIPLIGGMACAVPSIMSSRTISNPIERMITIMVTPLMSCSARIPVYVLLIGIFVPEKAILGVFNLQGMVMIGMYLVGFILALLVALVIKKIKKYDSSGIFVTELPMFRVPRWKNTFMTMYQKAGTFVWEAGKVIMVISIILWILSSFGPGNNFAEIDEKYDSISENGSYSEEELGSMKASEKLKASYAGYIGRGLEPLIRPLGFDWKIGISLVTSFAAREVFVGTMATIYSAGEDENQGDEGQFASLRRKMIEEKDPETGLPVYSFAVALSLLMFYAISMQCMSTLAIVYKETKSWKLTVIMVVYLTALAYGVSFVTYQLASMV